jgi:hypothetical protein
MFDLIKISDAEYELKASSGGLVGRFLLEVDGCYYFELAERRRSAVWSDYALVEIGTKLKELNQPWYDHLDKHFKN